MAELVGGAVLSSFLGVAFDRLSSPDVVNWIKGKKLDKLLATLKTTLYAAQALLNDAENKQIKDTAVKDWLDSLKDVVYKADDLLDEVSTKAATQKDPGNFWSRYLNLQDREIANRMEDIIDALESILKHKDALGLKEIPKEDMSWRSTTSLVKISNIYGRDNDKEAITKLLLDNTSDGEVSVIPIVGQGGIGKTTLAQLVYHDDKVKKHFDFQSWVCVSEEFDVIKVTRTIIEAISPGSCNTNDLNLLQHDLNEKLSRRKFLVVLDDAWNENYDDWIRLLKPFQQGVKGSTILITTRSRKVASVVQTVPPHELSLLSHEDCWLVFVKHALLSTDSIEYPTLEKIGREIVNKCIGLPLAAQTLGGLLRGNYDARYWNHVLKSEIWEFSECRSRIISALRISYYYLPLHLKECFVFCSLYPKDYEFDKHRLILLWIAENFIQPKGRKTLEEVGSEYFDELVARSFFQPLRTNLNAFVMHDLMHDLAMLCAREFYFRVDELGDATEIGIKTRHLSHNAKGNHPISKLLATCDNIKCTRTFIQVNLNPFYRLKNMEIALILSQLKYLRVLSLEYSLLDHDSLPHSIGELIHLRYLDLSYTHIATLPESLGNLYNLQTLRLFGCFKLEMLPNGMQDLVNLLYLDIRGTCLKEMPKGMSKLKHLQFLSSFIVGKHPENGISELGALSNIHESLLLDQLENVTNSGEALKARMADKEHIMDLTLRWSSDYNVGDSQVERDILEKLQPHKNLIKLRIERYMGTHFSDWLGHSSYHNMTKVSLHGCRNCCRLPSLGQLPSLKSLFISRFDGLEIIREELYESDESCCKTPFPSLETLHFSKMDCWREWHSFKLDAFPRLKELTMKYCPLLMKDLPNRLPALEKLTIAGCKQLACSLPRGPAILDIRGCDEFRIHELPLSLRSLSIRGSQLVESVFEAMTRTQPTCLKYLFISDCSSAILFPGGFVPASLEEMHIVYSRELEFPMQQQQQQHEFLRSITVSDSCDSLSSFHLDSFPNLTGLIISGCENVKSLVMSETRVLSLRSLSISRCPSFVSLSTLGTNAPNLESLRIYSCPEIDSFAGGVLPPNMRELVVRGCEKLVRCLSLMDLHSHSLSRLEIRGPCESIKSFPKEGVLPASLKYLNLSDLQSLQMLDCGGFLHLASFKQLHIGDCPKLENIVGERLPASLTQLRIKRCPLLGKRFHRNDPQIWSKISHIKAIDVVH